MRERAAGAEADGPFSVGEYLKAQRTIRGIALEELASRTRIPLRSLSLLESGAFDRNPDGFVRGFVRTVSEGLGMNPDDTLVRMLSEPVAADSLRTRLAASLPAAWLVVLGGAAVLAVASVIVLVVVSVEPRDDVRSTVIRRDPVRALAAAHAAASRQPGPAALRDVERTRSSAGSSSTGRPDTASR